jgi:hypothetical protein
MRYQASATCLSWIPPTAVEGMSGGGRLGSTTLRLRTRGLTFAGVALPDMAPPPEVQGDRVRFTQTAGGHTGTPVPRAVGWPCCPVSSSTVRPFSALPPSKHPV